MKQQAIRIPDVCPSCGSSLELITDQLYCNNSSCPAKNSKIVEGFSKRLRIKGLGSKTIEKLDLECIEDIYLLSKEFIEERLGSEKLATKLVNEIELSKNANLQELLPAFAIPLFGSTASQKLCNTINHIDELTEKKCSEAALGPKVTTNICSWYKTEYKNRYQTLPFTWKADIFEGVPVVDINEVVCISGRLTSYKTKAEAKAELEKYGYRVKDTLTKDVTILVNESGIASAKTKSAETKGITIITNIKKLIGEKHGST
jgi:NAD-dependent DNA ligase